MSAPAEFNQSLSILTDKVNRALQVRTDTPAMKAALEALTHLHQDQEANVDSRGVRVAIEKDALQQALLLQGELSKIVDQVTKLRQTVSQVTLFAKEIRDASMMDVVSERPNTQETSAYQLPVDLPSTNPGENQTGLDELEAEQLLAANLSDAFSKRDAAKARLEAVQEFLEKYNLSQEDSRLLDHYDFQDVENGETTPNGTAFLKALGRVQIIRQELTHTFGGTGDLLRESSSKGDQKGLGTSSALRLTENLAQKQERAYERLYHWLHKYLHLLRSSETETDSLDELLQHAFVKDALETLRNVPAFYVHTLELIANSRRSEATRKFLLALTSGYEGLAPIEMKAHDPVTYVGDMLAFAFRAFSDEIEISRSLLKPEEASNSIDAKTEDFELSSSVTMTPVDMLAICTGGIARPLKSRILQVVATLARRQDDDAESDDGLSMEDLRNGVIVPVPLVNLYEIFGLLLFYTATMEKAAIKLTSLESDADLSKVSFIQNVLDCLKECASSYEAAFRVYCATLNQVAASTGESEARLISSLVEAIADVQKHSPGFSVEIPCPEEIQMIVSIDWATESLISAYLSRCSSLNDCSALQEALHLAISTGMNQDAASALEMKILETHSVLLDSLVAKETENVLALCGLSGLLQAFREWKEENSQEPMADFRGLSQTEVEMYLKDFQASLYSPPLPSLETSVKDRATRKKARTKIADTVCQVYSEFYESASSPVSGGYQDTAFLSHNPEQVRTLFSV